DLHLFDEKGARYIMKQERRYEQDAKRDGDEGADHSRHQPVPALRHRTVASRHGRQFHLSAAPVGSAGPGRSLYSFIISRCLRARESTVSASQHVSPAGVASAGYLGGIVPREASVAEAPVSLHGLLQPLEAQVVQAVGVD